MASLLRRVGSQAVRRLSWGVADQAVSSLTNYAVVLYIARSLGAKQFGAFSLAYVTYGFALNASRGLSTDSLLVRFSGTDLRTWRRAVASCTGTATLVGLATGTCALVAAALLHGTAKLGFFALGLTLPGLLLQDSWRYSFFAHGRGSQALLNDMVWGLALLPALALVQITHHVDVFWCVFAWGAAAGVAAAVGPLQARLVPRLSHAQGWMTRHRDLGFRYLAENTAQSASVQLRAYGVGFVLGLAAVAYVQAASTLMGPFMVIFFGLGLVTVPEAARVLRRSPRQLPRFCLLVGAGLATAAFMWGAALLAALPHGLGDLLLPRLWRPTYPLILPLTICLMGGCFSAGAGTGLHALAAARRSLRATVMAAATLVVCALVGADAAGVVGTMWGSAVAGWIGALLFWWQLRAALKESRRVHGRRRARRNRHPDRSRPSGQQERSAAARLSATTAVVADIDGTGDKIPPADELTRAPGRPSAEPVEVLARGRLPRVAELDPYTLGATPSAYGSAVTYGHRDSYVQRTADEPLAAALRPSRLVILVGPPKAGKTRTAFEVVRSSNVWRDALLAAPSPGSLAKLAEQPGLSGSGPLVIWLDNLPRFLPPAGDLSQATISRLLDRPGPTVLLATLCAGQPGPLRGTWAGLTGDVRTVLNHATVIELKSTSEDPAEQELSYAIYPQVASGPEGLAEVLAGVPELLSRYRNSATTDPILYALVRTCVDWARCGFTRPIPEPDLLAIVGDALAEDHPGPGQHDGGIEDALRRACQPLATAGQAALLRCNQLQDQTRAYDAADYLIVADDGQGGRTRPLTNATWRRLLSRAASQDALGIGVAAYLRGNKPVAVTVSRHAAEADLPEAQYCLGLLLADQVDPPDLAEAHAWWTRAAEAGHTDAQFNLGVLLANRLDPPDLDGARTWWTRAAEAGHTDAQFNLGVLLADLLDPPALAEARAWYTRAAEAGDTDAQFNLGLLLANRLDPPDLDGARTWWTRAAEAGDADARFNLGLLLAKLQNAPDLAEARTSYTQAAEVGVSRTPLQPQAPDGHQTVAAGARPSPNQLDAGR